MEDEQTRLEKELGRKIEREEVQCQMCSGVGGNGWEDTCTACDGEGRVMVWIYSDCKHEIEGNECHEDDCDYVCQQMVDLGSYCDRPYAETVREPFTPAGFELRCCRECADDYLKQGYLKARAA